MTKKQYENTSIRGSDVEGDCLLPVVIFNFSKAYCDEAAEFLKGQDLLTGKEKGEVIMCVLYSVFCILYFMFFGNVCKHKYLWWGLNSMSVCTYVHVAYTPLFMSVLIYVCVLPYFPSCISLYFAASHTALPYTKSYQPHYTISYHIIPYHITHLVLQHSLSGEAADEQGDSPTKSS